MSNRLQARHLLSLAAGVALTAAASVGALAAPQGELKIGLPTLYSNSFLPQATVGFSIVYQSPVFDFLVATDAAGNFDPSVSVAEKWETSPDGKSWTFQIRKGIRFHNGDALTADDVQFTLDMTVTAKNTAGRRSDFVEFFDKVETDGPDKVIVRLKKPWPTFLYFLSDLIGVQGMIVPKAYYESKGEENFLRNPVGSGPYKVQESVEGSHIKLQAAQDTHWRVKEPKYRTITFRSLPESGTRVAALKNHEIDLISVGLSEYADVKKGGFDIIRKEDGALIDLSFLRVNQQANSPLNNPKVREALQIAIDRKDILQQILSGEGNETGTTLALFTWAFDYKPFPPIPFDPEKAKRLLAEAGYPNGFEISLYSFVQGLPEMKLVNEAIAAYWEAIGMKPKILEMDYSAFRPFWMKQKEPPGPAAFAMDWPNRPFYSWRGTYYSTATFGTVSDPKLDEMIDKSEAELDQTKYIALSQQIMTYVRDQSYSSGIATAHQLYAKDKSVPNWELGRSFGSIRAEYIGAK